MEHIYFEIKNSGYENKLIAGIVITGGGSQMKHISQLFEYITGMDTRIGYPTEHLAKGNTEEITSPMYATGVGLVIKGFHKLEKQREVTGGEKTYQSSTDRSKRSFLEKILKKGQEFFEEEDR